MRLSHEVDPRERWMLQRASAAARWSMDRQPGECSYNIQPRTNAWGKFCGYNILMVDNTRKSRDPNAGVPILVGITPNLEEANHFVAECKRGKKVFQIRGFKTTFEGRPPTPDAK